MTTYTFPLDVDDLHALARKAVELRGEDFVYERGRTRGPCLYWHESEGAPGCIIGTILWLAGVSSEDISYCDKGSSLAVINSERVKKFFTPDAVEYADAMQQDQDNGKSWGAAVDRTFKNYNSNN